MKFQYRKRYEVTCDLYIVYGIALLVAFQYRKRYEVTCDTALRSGKEIPVPCFNTASGMRSHVTLCMRRQYPSSQDVSIPQAV